MSNLNSCNHKESKAGFLFSFIGVLGTMLLFLLIVVFAYVAHLPEPTDESVVEERRVRLADLKAKEKQEATTYRWINKKNGVVGIPVEKAMELTVNELSTNQSL